MMHDELEPDSRSVTKDVHPEGRRPITAGDLTSCTLNFLARPHCRGKRHTLLLNNRAVGVQGQKPGLRSLLRMKGDAENLKRLNGGQACPMKVVGTAITTSEGELMHVSGALCSKALTEKTDLHRQTWEHRYLVHCAESQPVAANFRTDFLESTNIAFPFDVSLL